MVRISDYLRPACLPSTKKLYQPGQEVWVAGIGANSTRVDPQGEIFLDFPNHLQQARLTLEHQGSCHWDHLGQEVTAEKDVICAVANEAGWCSQRTSRANPLLGEPSDRVYPSPCRGDSGAGLMATLRGPCSSCCQKWYVIGIHSFSNERCGWKSASRSITAYISTQQHLSWIHKVVRNQIVSKKFRSSPQKVETNIEEQEPFALSCSTVPYGTVCCNPSSCYLHCQPGWVPKGKTVAKTPNSLKCVAAVAVVLGGYGQIQQTDQPFDWTSLIGQSIPPFEAEVSVFEDLSMVEVYSPSGGCNRRLAPLPRSSRDLVTALVDGQLLACGGDQELRQDEDEGRRCWTYHPRNDSWTLANSMIVKRKAASCAAVLGKLYVTGGYWQNEDSCNSTEVWSGGSWNKGADIDPARDGHCSVAYNNISFITSGGWMVEDVVQIYSVNSKSWIYLASLPPQAARRNHGCAMLNYTHMIIAGGTGPSDEGDLPSSWVLDVPKNRWVQVGDLSAPRNQASLVNVGGQVLALAGYTQDKYSELVEAFNPIQENWTKLQSKLITRRRGQAVAAVPTTWFNFFLNGCNVDQVIN